MAAFLHFFALPKLILGFADKSFLESIYPHHFEGGWVIGGDELEVSRDSKPLHTVDGSEIPFPTTERMVEKKPCN